MKEQTKEQQAREYVYELGNCAVEYGFKPDESWELSLATVAEKLSIERNYYPTIATKVLPERLANLLSLIKVKMELLKMNFASKPLPEQPALGQLQYIIAFNPARQRR